MRLDYTMLENTEGTGGLYTGSEAWTASTHSLWRHHLNGEMDLSGDSDSALHVIFSSQIFFFFSPKVLHWANREIFS